jgi:hypothetical protein
MTDFSRKRGDTFSLSFTVQDSSGTAIDITGASFKLTINQDAQPEDTTNQLAQLIGVIVDAANGIVRFDPDATSVGTVGVFFYDVEMTDSGGKVRTLTDGTWTIVQDITK